MDDKELVDGSLTREPNTAETQNNGPLVPDLSLIHGYGHPEDGRQEIPVDITRFQRGNKILDFVTANHSGDLDDPTHRTVKAAIETGNPQIVITEGHATDMPDEKRKEIIDWTKREVEKVQKNNNVQDEDTFIPEAGYTAYVALEQGIPSVGGEISGNEFLTKMQAHGYSVEDVLADSFMRFIETIPLQKRETMTEEEFMTNQAERLLANANARVDPQRSADITSLTLDQFKEWYAAHPLSRNRRFLDVDNKDFEPHQGGEYFQVMACESGVVRDEHIAELLADLLKQNDRVTIVYGSGHLNSLRPLLENMFDDKGSFTRLVDEDTPPQQAA